MLMQTSRNGYFFVLDRTTGKSLLTEAFRSGELVEGSRQGWPARFPILTRNQLRTAA